jgi:N-acetylmuramoyl-L-alanine amidase
VGGSASVGTMILLFACAVAAGGPPDAPAPAVAVVAAAPAWPASGAPLKILDVAPSSGRVRVLVDAGHGTLGNDGNTSVRCEKESAFTLRAQDELARRLARIPAFDVEVTRKGAATPSYDDRLLQMEKWPADAVISLHSDARIGDPSGADPKTGCPYAENASGFSVLYSDEGDPKLVTARLSLARQVASRMTEAGFHAYIGPDYNQRYIMDATPGVWVDRHPDAQRIKMLRRSKVPLVIVETHQALDPDEVLRWDEPRTYDAFAAAIGAAIAQPLTPPPSGG